MSTLERYLDQQGPDFVEAHIALIDALRNYIRANNDVVNDFLFDGTITRAEAARWYRERQPLRMLLQDLEADTPDDGTLHELMQKVRHG